MIITVKIEEKEKEELVLDVESEQNWRENQRFLEEQGID